MQESRITVLQNTMWSENIYIYTDHVADTLLSWKFCIACGFGLFGADLKTWDIRLAGGTANSWPDKTEKDQERTTP